MNRNEVLINAKIWMNSQNTILNRKPKKQTLIVCLDR